MLLARLDRLAAAKEVAQLAAALGREFGYELLAAVAPWDAVVLQGALARLVGAELLYQRGLPPQATYVFKHALVQEAAYQSLLKRRRQQFHRRIAEALATRFPEVVERQPEALARHYTEAGQAAQAVPAWLRAGERAAARSANAEAVAHLSRGLAALEALPAPKRLDGAQERARQELALQLALGPALRAVRGHTAPEVEQAYARARALCQQIGEAAAVFPALWGLANLHMVRAEYRTARELAEQCVRLARRQHDPALLVAAHGALGMILLWLGDLVPATEHLDRAIGLYDPVQHPQHAHRFGMDRGVIDLTYGAWLHWLRGYPDQGRERSRTAVALARGLGHPFTLATALSFTALLHTLRPEAQAALEEAEAAVDLATEHGYPQLAALGAAVGGWALAVQGRGAAGASRLREGMGAWRAMGSKLWWPTFLALLAEVHLQQHRVEPALAAVAEALAAVEATGERWYEAELHRLRGEALLSRAPGGPAEEAEACFLRAIGVARRQGAKSLELRAAVDLARLWQRQGQVTEARELLSGTYGWFTEGFDTADLQAAQALLRELGELA